MSGIPVTRKLWITPLSPVHMGTDEDYVPTGYVIDDGALHEFDHRALENLPVAERHKLDGMLAGKANTEMLKRVQAFFHHNREWLIPAAVNLVPVSEEMEKLYKARVGKAANIERDGKQVLHALEIERAAYHPVDRRLYLPGTGLKGAIRTALLDAVNAGQDTRHGERNRDLQQRLFRYTMRDLYKDPMRLVQVGDCAWRAEDALNSAEILFAVNRKKRPVRKNGELLASQAEKQNLHQLLECATPFRFRAFQGHLNIAEPVGVEGREDALPELRFSFGEIATACNRYFRPIFERETRLLRERGYLDSRWRETVERLLGDEDLARRLAANDAFLLRVGRHSGAESVTLNGVRSIKIMQGKGEKPSWEEEPKTLWLATADQQDQRYLRPFGWLLVEMTEPGEALPDWPAAEAMMADHAREMREWLRAVEDKKNELAERVAKAREEAGRHSGAESVTLNGVRSIKIMQGKGEKPSWEEEPKTLWLATADQQDQRYLRPFGWLLVEMTEPGEALPDWPAAEAMMADHAREMREWLRAVEDKKNELAERVAKAREEAERKAREDAEKAVAQARREAEEAEKKHRAEAVRQAELAKMEPIEREIAEFASVLEVIKALQQQRWGQDQRKAARFLKKRMQAEKCWRPESKAKKPEKDKPHQRTRIVMQYLDEA